jgi:hypothetical protein
MQQTLRRLPVHAVIARLQQHLIIKEIYHSKDDASYSAALFLFIQGIWRHIQCVSLLVNAGPARFFRMRG